MNPAPSKPSSCTKGVGEEDRGFFRERRCGMKAKIDPEICIGCGLCETTCPEVYRMEGDKAIVIVDIVPKEAEGNCKKAADECPVTAIIIEE